jgi:hypothetical protein
MVPSRQLPESFDCEAIPWCTACNRRKGTGRRNVGDSDVCAFESKSLSCRPPLTTNSGHNTDLRAVSRDGHLVFGHFVEPAQPKFPQLFASTSMSTSRLTRGVRVALLVSLLYIVLRPFFMVAAV